MAKKLTTKMSEIGAVEFGTLLQDGKIIKMRAGKATIEHTVTKRGKATTTTFHLNLKPQIVHQEVELPDAVSAVLVKPKGKPGRPKKTDETSTPAEAPVKRKRGRPKKVQTETVETPTEDATPVKRKPGRPKKVTTTEDKPKGKPRRKKRVKQGATEPAADQPVKRAKPVETQAANMPWNDDELDDDDYKL